MIDLGRLDMITTLIKTFEIAIVLIMQRRVAIKNEDTSVNIGERTAPRPLGP